MSNVGLAGNSIYAGSKGALVSFAKSLALEVAKKRIRVNCISPGLVLTPLTENAHSPAEIQNYDESNPLGIGKTTDIAELLMFLLSNKSGWITGTNIVIDGGYSAK
jgi:NAD(P)-dependent dehydrogenase (short-subunit alcohol dehydrogenase family)